MPEAEIVIGMEKADKIVSKMYQELLGRSPDKTGRWGKIQSLMGGMSEEDIRKSIIQSKEYQGIKINLPKVLLINFHNNQTYSAMYNLVALASYLEKENIEVQVIDGIRQPIWDIIKTWKPDIIGLTSYTIFYKNVVEYGLKIKQYITTNNINSKIIIGGNHITSAPVSMKVPPFDYACVGEGEEVLVQLCKALKAETPLSSIKGLIDHPTSDTDKSSPVDINKLPVVRLDKYTPIDFYKDGMVGIVGSRGCAWNCHYCSIRTMSKAIRFRPINTVVDEIQMCYDKLGSRTIACWDDTFSINLNWLQSLIEDLDKKKLLGKIQYHVHMRASIVNEERCELMKKMGVTVWNMGLDFGSDKILKQAKGTDSSVEKNKEALLMAHRYGIATGGSVIFGAPGETIDHMKETLLFLDWYSDMIQKGLCSGSIWGFVATPLPGTEWWKYAESIGKVSADMDYNKLGLHNWNDHFLLDKSVTENDFNWVHNEFKRLMIKINGSWSEP